MIHFRVVASNPDGTAFGADQTFRTLRAAPTGPAAPTLGAARLTHARFRVSAKPTAVTAKARARVPVGTAFRFTLTAPAKVTIAITRSAPGLRRGHGCVAPTASLRRRHAKRCTRTLTVGTLVRANEAAGADSVAFSGRIGSRALAPRGYKALLSASNPGGRSRIVQLAFTVVR